MKASYLIGMAIGGAVGVAAGMMMPNSQQRKAKKIMKQSTKAMKDAMRPQWL